jgi:ribonuclease BN (tRNA processing enzyme)/GTPase SAR1 family protein
MNRYNSIERIDELVGSLCGQQQRLLLLGPPGIGKTTLAAALANRLSNKDNRIWCLAADPGMSPLGVPGAVNLGFWQKSDWVATDHEALCSLDAARFRLPLVDAVRRLAAKVHKATLLLDSPGVVRGVAGAELLTSMVHGAGITLVIALVREAEALPLHQELQALGVDIIPVLASAAARRPGKGIRDRERTRLWNDYLKDAVKREVSLTELRILGTPPRQAPEAWRGKQVAFLANGATVGMAEVVGLTGDALRLLLPPSDSLSPVLLVRDAVRDESGLLVTGKRFAESVVRYLPPSDLVQDSRLIPDSIPRPMVQTRSASAVLLNGVFGDPQLHLRLAHQRRSLLFDLGDGSRLPARVAHQVSDVFISHAHMDHISGFMSLLRSRIGESGICRLYGPPGLATHIEHLINGIHWDRIGERGPAFVVLELHGDRLICCSLQAGQEGRRPLSEQAVANGIVLEDPGFLIRAVTLDHGIPVLAYAFEPTTQINIRKEQLQQHGLEPGPWLTELKEHILRQQFDHLCILPNGTPKTVATLADELTLITVGSKLVYATDLADTPDNRNKLINLARNAHTLFCESPFLQRESDQAGRTSHLTTIACAKIANEAGVNHLIPFHFSRRHESEPWLIYNEIATCCPQLVMPSGMIKKR